MTLAYKHLTGLPYRGGERDCYELVRDFFRDNFEIELTAYARPTDWRADKDDLIGNLHGREGFHMITDWRAEDLRPADVLCLAIGEGNPNHLAVYVGDNTIVHHLFGRFSAEEPYRDFFRNSTCYLCRHPDVPDLRPVLPETTIEELLRARHAA